MAEYIEREAVLKHKTLIPGFIGEYVHADRIRESPAADVVEVKHGRWMPCEPDSDVRFYCSKCETEISTSWDYDQAEMWNFCPNCGARMDGDGDA